MWTGLVSISRINIYPIEGEIPILSYAYRVDPGQTLADMGLHCVAVSFLWETRYKEFKLESVHVPILITTFPLHLSITYLWPQFRVPGMRP